MKLTCGRCNQTKDESEFNKASARSTGRASWCKVCCRQYVIENKDRLSKKREEYRASNRSKCIQGDRDYYSRNREQILLRRKELMTEDRRRRKAQQDKRYYNNNFNKVRAKAKEYRDNNREKIQAYKVKNKERARTQANERCKRRKVVDPLFQLCCITRSTIHKAIARKGYKKCSRTAELLGCTYEDFMRYLGPKPCDNAELDHICPVAQAQTEEEVIKLQSYINFQWLPKEENLKKLDKQTDEGLFLCRFLLGRDWVFKE